MERSVWRKFRNVILMEKEKMKEKPIKFADYFNGKLVRFLDYEDKLYVDTDDLALIFERTER